jgi:hypothetical protein
MKLMWSFWGSGAWSDDESKDEVRSLSLVFRVWVHELLVESLASREDSLASGEDSQTSIFLTDFWNLQNHFPHLLTLQIFSKPPSTSDNIYNPFQSNPTTSTPLNLLLIYQETPQPSFPPGTISYRSLNVSIIAFHLSHVTKQPKKNSSGKRRPDKNIYDRLPFDELFLLCCEDVFLGTAEE